MSNLACVAECIKFNNNLFMSSYNCDYSSYMFDDVITCYIKSIFVFLFYFLLFIFMFLLKRE